MRLKILFLAGVAVEVMAAPLLAQVEVLGAFYRGDEPFPEFARFWTPDDAPTDESANAGPKAIARATRLGASFHGYVLNKGRRPMVFQDLRMEGISLKQALVPFGDRKVRKPHSLFHSTLSEEQKDRLVAAGEPIWYRLDPPQVAPGGVGHVVVRLRQPPKLRAVRLELQCEGGAAQLTFRPDVKSPRFEGIYFSPRLDAVYLYPRFPDSPGRRPRKVLLDGKDVTRAAQVGADPRIDVTPIVLELDSPLQQASMHCFQVEYDNNAVASAALRAWCGELAYGVWGGPGGKKQGAEVALDYWSDLQAHNVNTQMPQMGSPAVTAYFRTPAGGDAFKRHGMQAIIDEHQKWGVKDPFCFFIHDEPDAGDAHIKGAPPGHEVGSLGQWAVQRSDELRTQGPETVQTLNIDLTYTPHNYYTYGQLPDIMMSDPYYQPRIREAYERHPDRLPLYSRCTLIYAITRVVQSAAAPNPVHIALYANAHIDKESKSRFRYPTPEEKRIEAHYALANGAKGLSFWWYTPANVGARGVGANDPEADALWRAIGLMGASVRTAESVILRASRADVPVEAPDEAFVRCLPAGLDTLMVVVVNEQYTNDQEGTKLTPLENATVTVALPEWLKAAEAFEVAEAGVRPVRMRAGDGKAVLDLGAVGLPRLVFVTADKRLGPQLDRVYKQQFAQRVARLTGGREK